MFKDKFDEVLGKVYAIRDEKVCDLNNASKNKFLSVRTQMAIIHPIQAEVDMVNKILSLLINLRKEV